MPFKNVREVALKRLPGQHTILLLYHPIPSPSKKMVIHLHSGDMFLNYKGYLENFYALPVKYIGVLNKLPYSNIKLLLEQKKQNSNEQTKKLKNKGSSHH